MFLRQNSENFSDAEISHYRVLFSVHYNSLKLLYMISFTDDGAVFVWGSGGEGQLGMGGKTECPEPEELRIEDVVTCISCGYYHTALVTGRSVELRGRGAAGYGWEERVP